MAGPPRAKALSSILSASADCPSTQPSTATGRESRPLLENGPRRYRGCARRLGFLSTHGARLRNLTRTWAVRALPQAWRWQCPCKPASSPLCNAAQIAPQAHQDGSEGTARVSSVLLQPPSTPPADTNP